MSGRFLASHKFSAVSDQTEVLLVSRVTWERTRPARARNVLFAVIAAFVQVLPLALKQKAETAVPEAANAAWVDSIVAEAPGGCEHCSYENFACRSAVIKRGDVKRPAAADSADRLRSSRWRRTRFIRCQMCWKVQPTPAKVPSVCQRTGCWLLARRLCRLQPCRGAGHALRREAGARTADGRLPVRACPVVLLVCLAVLEAVVCAIVFGRYAVSVAIGTVQSELRRVRSSSPGSGVERLMQNILQSFCTFAVLLVRLGFFQPETLNPKSKTPRLDSNQLGVGAFLQSEQFHTTQNAHNQKQSHYLNSSTTPSLQALWHSPWQIRARA